MKTGVRVKLTKQAKEHLIENGCDIHVKEFGDCVGITDGYIATYIVVKEKLERILNENRCKSQND